MPEPAEPKLNSPARSSLRLVAFEIASIVLVFFLFGGSLPPDVGESHYLVKAKHYWQPAWCAGDLFVESRDAHAMFYWTFGWVTRFARWRQRHGSAACLPGSCWPGRGDG